MYWNVLAKQIKNGIPAKLSIALLCILIIIILCYAFSVLYIHLTDPVEPQPYSIANENQPIQDIQDGRLKDGELNYSNPSFVIYPEDKNSDTSQHRLPLSSK